MLQNKRKPLFLFVEYGISFYLLPGAICLKLLPVPKFSILIALSVFSLIIILSKPGIYKAQLFSWKLSDIESRQLFLRFLLFVPVVIILTLILAPEVFFKSFYEHPLKWALTAVLYVLFSALPQEILYRAFFFYRYSSLFKKKHTLIFFNALAFSFLHIIYNNLIAVTFTFAGGYLFASTYNKSKSIIVTTFEHSLYGWIIFTTGLGQTYFM